MFVLVTDIFGETFWTQSLMKSWHSKGHKAITISPYDEKETHFNNNADDEQQAYEQFQQVGGMKAYTEKVKSVLQQIILDDEQVLICIGFSAGASALWNVAALNSISLTYCIGFYPGQIRHALSLTPLCPFTLVFPEFEQHFDLETVIQHLVTKQNTQVLQVKLKHGYANPQSVNYNQTASEELSKLLIKEEFKVNLDGVALSFNVIEYKKSLISRLNKLTHKYVKRECAVIASNEKIKIKETK